MAPPTPTPDVLFARHLAGDAAALEELAARLSPELREFARQIGADAEQSEDAVQDMWLAVLTSRESFDVRRPLLPWLRALLRFRWRSAYRREQRLRALIADAWSARPANGHARADSEAEALVRAALQRLPAHYRTPLELQLVGGLSPVEIAARLSLPRSTVRVLLHRGRAALRASLPRGMWALLALLLLRRRSRAAPAWPVAASIAVTLVLCMAAASRVVSGASASDSPRAISSVAPPLIAAPSFEVAAADSARELVAADEVLTVTTVDGDGRALAGVGITVEPRDGSDPRLHRLLAATDASGRARFPVRADVPLRIASDRRVAVELDAGERACKLTITGGRSVRGRAVDARGAALVGAEVWLGDVGSSRRGQIVTLTDSEGAFALDGVPDDAKLALFAAGFRRTRMSALPPASAIGITRVQLTATAGGATVRVVVRDSAGTPLPGARVSIGRSVDGLPQALADGMLPAFPPPFERIADDEGLVVAEGLEPGDQPIVARAAGHAPVSRFVRVDDGDAVEVELRMPLGATLRGRVVDLSGEPLAGAQVAWSDGDALDELHLISARDGSFVADGIPSGPATIGARGFDHGVAERRLDSPAGPTLDLELALSTLPTCEGDLRDDAGEPLPGFEIRLLGAPESELAPNADDDRTDERGRFALAVPGGQIRRVEVRGPGWPQWTNVKRSWLREEPQTLHVTLPRAAMPASALVGRLRYADGSAVRDRALDLLCFDPAEDDVVHDVARTSPEGDLRVGPLPAGRYALVLSRRGESDEPLGVVGEYELAAGAELDVSQTLPAAGEWTCDLRFADGDAPTAIVASLTTGDLRTGLALWRTPEQHLRLLPGKYALHAMGDEFVWIDGGALEVASAQSARWDAPLERATSVRLRVAQLPEDVDATPGLTLTRCADDVVAAHFELLVGSQRAQVLQSFLRPGKYRATVQRWNGQAVDTTFLVDSAQPRELELRFDL